jgi:hypothetical protein
MWGRLRIILLIGTALLLAFFAYVVIDSSIIHPHKEPILDYVLVYGIFIYLCVNLIYLVRRPGK